MAELKTKKTKASVTVFLKGVENDQRRKDSLQLLKIFKEVTKKRPKMWGSSIVGLVSITTSQNAAARKVTGR